MKKVLYTAFKGKNNSSFQLVSEIDGFKVFLTNSYKGLEKDIENINDDYDEVIMFGLDKNLKESIRFETVAQKCGDNFYTRKDLSEYTNKADKLKIQYVISEVPTHYLCNEAYYQMMKKMDCPVLFVHIPTLKNMSEELRKNTGIVFMRRC
jgi:pyrrolidone-carboxylate peptidase